MAKAAVPTNGFLTNALNERILPLEVRAVHELRSSSRAAAIGRIGRLDNFTGAEIERFALQEGRGRELLIYMLERAARHMRTWRARGFTGTLYIPLQGQEMADRTIATSFDVIAKSQSLDQSAFTAIVPLADYLTRYTQVANAIGRIRKAGCGVAMAVDHERIMKFTPPVDHPFTAFMLGGKGAWTRLRTIGPGRLGALGSWIGWAESLGLQRTALGIMNNIDAETARLYGFTHGEGLHYADYIPARDFIPEPAEAPAVQEEEFARTAEVGLPSRPSFNLSRA